MKSPVVQSSPRRSARLTPNKVTTTFHLKDESGNETEKPTSQRNVGKSFGIRRSLNLTTQTHCCEQPLIPSVGQHNPHEDAEDDEHNYHENDEEDEHNNHENNEEDKEEQTFPLGDPTFLFIG
ncbi:hypothetical protein ACH5RR_025842 [Cinchona calisaya]|uniref:Uncharacterized protein n=1 Tax=Cinchona calisaya TaxID=153742 RepID=A0ABD2Z0T4_9GENT